MLSCFPSGFCLLVFIDTNVHHVASSRFFLSNIETCIVLLPKILLLDGKRGPKQLKCACSLCLNWKNVKGLQYCYKLARVYGMGSITEG